MTFPVQTMEITLNGKPLEIEKPLAIADLMAKLGIEPTRAVAELNGEIVMREKFPSELLKGGDRLEIVRFVGGG